MATAVRFWFLRHSLDYHLLWNFGVASAAVSRHAFVATATAIGLIVDAARMPVCFVTESAAIASVSRPILIATAGVLAGTFLGMRVLHRIPEDIFRRVVRVMVGAVFLSEGIQKFLFSEELEAGRFARIGLPAPEVLAPMVGSFEVTGGALVLLGWLTRAAVVPLVAIMLVAIASTKIPILVSDGWWSIAHESRTDWSMLLGSIFLLIEGGGRWSVDGRRTTT